MNSRDAEPDETVHVLIVEDEVKTRDSLAEGLSMEHWEVATAATGNEALAILETESFDLVVLDWMLPDREGIEIVREVRQSGRNVPVLMLTARAAPSDRIAGFESGADDYLPKPFAFAELVARCRALVHRPPSRARRLLWCDDLVLDTRTRTVKRGGDSIQLTPREIDLLEYLMRTEGQIITTEMLEREVWKRTPQAGPFDRIVDVQMTRLSSKIDGERAGRLIHTVRGIGYRFGLESTTPPTPQRCN